MGPPSNPLDNEDEGQPAQRNDAAEEATISSPKSGLSTSLTASASASASASANVGSGISSTGSTGGPRPLHPELQNRLAALGFGTAAELLQAAPSKSSKSWSSVRGSDRDRERGAPTAKGGSSGTAQASLSSKKPPLPPKPGSRGRDSADEKAASRSMGGRTAKLQEAADDDDSNRDEEEDGEDLEEEAEGEQQPKSRAKASSRGPPPAQHRQRGNTPPTTGPPPSNSSTGSSAGPSRRPPGAGGASGSVGPRSRAQSMSSEAAATAALENTDLDDLLAQLDDLDARSKALQRDAKSMEGPVVVPRESSRPPPKRASSERRPPPAGRSEEAKSEGREVRGVSCDGGGGEESRGGGGGGWQHPLKDVVLGPPGSEFRRGGTKARDRSRPAQGSVDTTAAPQTQQVSSPPGTARDRRQEARVPLPPLNPSASAPGKLLSGPWAPGAASSLAASTRRLPPSAAPVDT